MDSGGSPQSLFAESWTLQIEGNRVLREEYPKRRGIISYETYLKDYQTLNLYAPPRSGKTTWIRNTAGIRDLIVVPYQHFAFLFPGKNVVSMDKVLEVTMPVSRVFFDDAFLISDLRFKRAIEHLWRKDTTNQTFVVLK